jgi:hypothetical protein
MMKQLTMIRTMGVVIEHFKNEPRLHPLPDKCAILSHGCVPCLAESRTSNYPPNLHNRVQSKEGKIEHQDLSPVVWWALQEMILTFGFMSVMPSIQALSGSSPQVATN